MKCSCYFVFNHTALHCPNLYSINLHNRLRHVPCSSFYSQLLNPPGLSLVQRVKVKVRVRVRVTLRLVVYRQSVRLGVKTLETQGQNFLFQLNTCGHSPYVTSSLPRGWVCRLQLLLYLARAFILRFASRRTHDHILLSQIRDSPNLEPRSPYIHQEQGGTVIPLGTGFLFRRLLRLAGLG
jgi:hypothetical protein